MGIVHSQKFSEMVKLHQISTNKTKQNTPSFDWLSAPKINREPGNDGFQVRNFLFQGAPIFRWTSRLFWGGPQCPRLPDTILEYFKSLTCVGPPPTSHGVVENNIEDTSAKSDGFQFQCVCLSSKMWWIFNTCLQTNYLKYRWTTLPETNIAPEKWMVGILLSYLGRPIFKGELLVSGRVILFYSIIQQK